jgi:hypothetical protein
LDQVLDNDAEIEHFPELELFIAKYQFCMCIELDIEALHGLAKPLSTKAHNVTAQYRSLTYRLPEVTEQLNADAEYFKAMAEKVNICKSADGLMCALGLQAHPGYVAQCKGKSGENEDDEDEGASHGQLWKLVYLCDIKSQFRDTSEVGKAIKDNEHIKKKRTTQALKDKEKGRLKEMSALELEGEVARVAAMQHLKENVLKPRMIMSCAEVAGTCLEPLSKRLRACAPNALQDDPDALPDLVPLEDEAVHQHIQTYTTTHQYIIMLLLLSRAPLLATIALFCIGTYWYMLIYISVFVSGRALHEQ